MKKKYFLERKNLNFRSPRRKLVLVQDFERRALYHVKA